MTTTVCCPQCGIEHECQKTHKLVVALSKIANIAARDIDAAPHLLVFKLGTIAGTAERAIEDAA